MTGSGTLADPFVIWNVNDLQSLNLDLTAHYKLGQDIDASATATWNQLINRGAWAPFTVYAVNDLVTNGGNKYYCITAHTSGGTFSSSKWQKTNLNAGDYLGFKPVGASVFTPFTGTFDGKGYAISTLYINRSGNNIGLFGFVDLSSGTIKDCSVSGTVTSDNGDFVGGLIGSLYTGTVSNCSSSASITEIGSGGFPEYIGGLVGIMYDATIDTCHATGQIDGGNLIYGAGGLVGDMHTSGGVITDSYATGKVSNVDCDGGGLIGISKGEITDCYATGDVDGGRCIGGLVGLCVDTVILRCHATGTATGKVTGSYPGDYIGGLFGSIWDGDIDQCFATGNVIAIGDCAGGFAGYINCPVDNCYARGSVSGVNYVGGFVGELVVVVMTNCYSTGLVIGTTSVGGFCGSNGGTITSCYWDTQTSEQATSDGGTGKSTEEMNHLSIFASAGWDFTSIWNISRVTTGLSTNITPGSAVLGGLLDLTIINEAYPFLRWQTVVELPCDCGFEWGETEAFGHLTAVDSKNTGESFAKAIAGLEYNTIYYYRALASASPGPIHGGTKSFTTLHAIEVETLPATNITENSARIWGRVRKVPVTAMAKFQWGGTIEYGAQTPWVPGLVSDDTFYYDLRNLAEGRAYHFRAVAMGSALVYGNDMTFTTRSPVGPVVLIQEELAHLMEAS